MKKPEQQYSKRALDRVIQLWFLGAFFGMIVCIVQLIRAPESVQLEPLLVYIGGPMMGGVISYMIKSAIEDKRKMAADAKKKKPPARQKAEKENNETWEEFLNEHS